MMITFFISTKLCPFSIIHLNQYEIHSPPFFPCFLREARLNGYVKTIVGRRRYLPDISSGDQSRRAHAERQAINSVVQVNKSYNNDHSVLNL